MPKIVFLWTDVALFLLVADPGGGLRLLALTLAEAAVIGKPDEVKGEAIKAFVILKTGYDGSEHMLNELRLHVRTNVGPIAVPEELEFVTSLPKTRSGKIMRRFLKAQELGQEVGDISTLEE